jgi:mono/diheme cytochrome c family protein
LQAFFNPLFWPSLFLRMAACASLAGVWALVTCSRIDGVEFPKVKQQLIDWSAKWLLPSFALMPVFFCWYLWWLPEGQRALLQLGVSTIGAGSFTQLTRTALIIPLSAASVVGVVYLFIWRSTAEVKLRHTVFVLLLALFATASAEYGREMLRKPYVIGQYMYSNGVRKGDVVRFNADGYLTASIWTGDDAAASPAQNQLARGQAMFRGQCAACHTRDAYRSMKRLIGERDRKAIGNMLALLHENKADSPYHKYMPPVVGKPDEIEALGDYLDSLVRKPAALEANAKKE